MAKEYEYQTLKLPADSMLNVEGDKGWRVISVLWREICASSGSMFVKDVVLMEREVPKE